MDLREGKIKGGIFVRLMLTSPSPSFLRTGRNFPERKPSRLLRAFCHSPLDYSAISLRNLISPAS